MPSEPDRARWKLLLAADSNKSLQHGSHAIPTQSPPSTRHALSKSAQRSARRGHAVLERGWAIDDRTQVTVRVEGTGRDWTGCNGKQSPRIALPTFRTRPHMNEHHSQSSAEPCLRTRAKARITVQSSQAVPYDQTAGPALVEVGLVKTFTGDIEGKSPVRTLQLLRAATPRPGTSRSSRTKN